MKIYLSERYMQYEDRKQVLGLMPTSEERTELLRNYVRDLESDILQVTGSQTEYSYLTRRVSPSKIREVSYMLMFRCWALNTMFYNHYLDTLVSGKKS